MCRFAIELKEPALNNDRIDLLVHALLSGEYTQGSGTLRRTLSIDGETHDGWFVKEAGPDSDVKYADCCLGVGCDVYRKATGQGDWIVDRQDGKEALGSTHTFKVGYESRDIVYNELGRTIALPRGESKVTMPSEVAEWFGLEGLQTSAMIDLNDEQNASFASIARWLQQGAEQDCGHAVYEGEVDTDD